MLALGNGRAFFVARDTDSIFELSPSCATPQRRLSVHDLATADPRTGEPRPANPHDVAAAPDGTLVIPLYTAGKLAFAKDGALDGAPLDLASYDPDGNPQADAVRIMLDAGGRPKAYVTLERLDDRDGLRSKQASQMLKVDVATRKVEGVVTLEGRNPFNPMAEQRGFLFLAEPGNFDSSDEDLAGIERFDTNSSTTKLLVRERQLGGSVTEIAIADGCGAAIVAGPEKDVNPTSLVTFDPNTGEVLASVADPVLGPTPGFDLQGLAWRGANLYVGDRRRTSSGYAIHVLRRTDRCTLSDTGQVIEIPQRPVALRPASAP